MFAVIYKGFVLEEKEDSYLKTWSFVAKYFKKNCEALGSTLHKTEDGEYVAYSRWPTKETRDRYWTSQDAYVSDEMKKAITILKSCLDPNKPSSEIQLHVVKDFIFGHDD